MESTQTILDGISQGLVDEPRKAQIQGMDREEPIKALSCGCAERKMNDE